MSLLFSSSICLSGEGRSGGSTPGSFLVGGDGGTTLGAWLRARLPVRPVAAPAKSMPPRNVRRVFINVPPAPAAARAPGSHYTTLPAMLYSPSGNPYVQSFDASSRINACSPVAPHTHLYRRPDREPPVARGHQADGQAGRDANPCGASKRAADAHALRRCLQRSQQGRMGGGAADGRAGNRH